MASFHAQRRTLLMALAGLGLGAPPAANAQQGPDSERGAGETLESWIDTYGRPTASVRINGEGPFRFLVDTGANTTVLAMRHALRLGAPILGVATVNGTTGAAELPVARIDTLSTGAVQRSGLRVALLDDAALARGDGILGTDVFAGRRLVFDIPRRVVRVERSRRSSRLGSGSPIRVRKGLLAEIRGSVGRVDAALMLDTGAQASMINPALSAALRSHHPMLPRQTIASVVGVTGQVMFGSMVVLPELDMISVKVSDARAIEVDAPIFKLWGLDSEPAMIVGVDVLSRAASFSIDYGARSFEAMPLAMIAGGSWTGQG
ncbi:MAG: aspartyl protease family protein [Alphaproteobacteria bacterium]|nr:aspartyl protease family protein [Alphaproteobacteria bacterium]